MQLGPAKELAAKYSIDQLRAKYDRLHAEMASLLHNMFLSVADDGTVSITFPGDENHIYLAALNIARTALQDAIQSMELGEPKASCKDLFVTVDEMLMWTLVRHIIKKHEKLTADDFPLMGQTFRASSGNTARVRSVDNTIRIEWDQKETRPDIAEYREWEAKLLGELMPPRSLSFSLA
jgi:hypothetical protein